MTILHIGSILIAAGAEILGDPAQRRAEPPVTVMPPPPIVITSAPPASPPNVVTSHYSGDRTAPAERYTIEVDIRADGQTLWAGPLRLATSSTTSFRRDQSEPVSAACETTGMLYRAGRLDALSITLNPVRYSGEGPSRLTVAVRWSRPDETACPSRVGTRVVEISDTLTLAPGQTITLTGDGGLVTRLTRR